MTTTKMPQAERMMSDLIKPDDMSIGDFIDEAVKQHTQYEVNSALDDAIDRLTEYMERNRGYIEQNRGIGEAIDIITGMKE